MGIVEEILKRRGESEKDLSFHREDRLNFPELYSLVKVLTVDFFLSIVGKVGILYDPDVDGLFSGYILEDFLTRMDKTVVNYINSGKKHGIVKETMDWVEREELDWLFVVDAGSNDIKRIKECVAKGVKVVILDHHPYVEKKLPKGAWVVNVSKYKELPPLSGCGVVYRFIEAVAEEFGMSVKQYETFVGITVLSDMCDMSNSENRYYVSRAYEGYRDNLFLKQFRFYGSHRSFYGWGVSPYLNALIRTGEEKRAVEVVNNMDRRIKMNVIQRDIKRVKARQEEMKEELFSRGKLKKGKGFFVHARRGVDKLKTLNGLVANDLLKEYSTGGLVLAYSNKTKKWVGSFRGLDFGKDTLEEWGFWTGGHDKACGVKIDNAGLKRFFKEFKNEVSSDINRADIYVNAGELSKEDWEEIALFNEYTGVGNKEIVVGYKRGMDVVTGEFNEYGVKSLYTPDGEVKDFTQSIEEDLKVVAMLDTRGYQFIRA